MTMTKIEKSIIKDEIDAQELLEYFQFQAEAKGEEFDLSLEDVVEYIENIKTKYADKMKSKTEESDNEKNLQKAEKLTPDQIRNRQILLASQKKK